jgi:uncharacterized protein YciI
MLLPFVISLRRGAFDARWATMFVIELIYKVDLAEIDAHMGAHVDFLKKYYASGHFLLSGRKIPRNGGIILAMGKVEPTSRPSSRRIRFTSSVSPIFASLSSEPANVRTTFRNGSRALVHDRAEAAPRIHGASHRHLSAFARRQASTSALLGF